MTRETLEKANKISLEIKKIEGKIEILEKYENLLMKNEIEEIEIVYQKSINRYTDYLKKEEFCFIKELLDKRLDYLNKKLGGMLKEFEEL